MRAAVVGAVVVGVLTACSTWPQVGPVPVVCDRGVPPVVCDSVWDEWHLMTEDLPQSSIVRIEVQCVACDPRSAEMKYWAVMTDGTRHNIGESSWVPDWGGLPEGPPRSPESPP